MNTTDTIASPASAIGGAVTVIRISGPEALKIGNAVWQGKTPLGNDSVRVMKLGKIGPEPVLAVYMKSPFSYTGDDVVEIHCHGGAASADHAMRKILSAGARCAEPGEFTFRAFVNGKIDLTQAEAVADIINSSGNAAFALAARQLNGALGNKLSHIYELLNQLRSECEARLDFPDEQLDFEAEPKNFAVAKEAISTLLATTLFADKLHHGIEIVLAGKPNAGKSSLLNALLGYDRAIVSPIPGTTRDTVEAGTVLKDLPVHLTDTAGLRETSDPVEKLGVERTFSSLELADVILFLLDSTAPDPLAELATAKDFDAKKVIVVWNKIDISGKEEIPDGIVYPVVPVSALTGKNIDLLIDTIIGKVFGNSNFTTPEVALNARCSEALTQAAAALEAGSARFAAGEFELAAAELATGARFVGSAIGKSVDPDLLDEVFKNFCIGK